VADAATDSASGQVLHVATGPFNLVLIQLPEKDRSYEPCAAGLVLSYHEFTRQRFERLNDAQWQKMCLRGEQHKLRPAWTGSFLR
jgi:hypothetical protein